MLSPELGMASAVCKSLYDNNVILKSKHQQLLARLPSTPSPSPSPEPLSRTSSRYSISLSRPISEYDASPVTSTYKSHARKISVSNAEISHLADQNAELLDKLERMEAESLSSDQSGRRQLKRLEKDIMTLREELEKTQAKSEELEQKAKTGWDSHKIVEEVLRKKEEREEKVKAFRNLGKTENEDDMEIRDFAPEGSVFGGPNASYSFFPAGNSARRITSTPLARPPYAPSPLTPHPESTLIAQLLEKMQELEETNTRILEQQTETASQLNAMQRETEHISKVYECFTDANIIEVAGDSASDAGDGSVRDETIRFKSFARNIGGDFSTSPSANDTHQPLNITAVPKARKSVVGLFDGSEEENIGASTPDQLKAFNLPVPFASPEGRPLDATGLVSPALSSLSLSPSRRSSQDPLNGRQRTLETELGNEFNKGWGAGADKHHLRKLSLFSDLSPISAPASPSPSSAHASFDHVRNIGSPNEAREALPTPMSMGNGALRLSVEPPTPDKVAAAAKHQEEVAAQSLRYHRMTETVRLRTSRWVDGRFHGSLTGRVKVDTTTSDQADEQKMSRPPTPLALRLTSAFDAAVENITGQPPRSPSGQEVVQGSEKKVEKKPKGFGSAMLELWLWLQFAIIILVFLWTMARRGPKSVLGETGHRRTRTLSSSRG